MPFVPDTPAKSAAPAAPAATGQANHFVPDAPAETPSGFWGNFAHELWQQGGQPLLEGLQNHPIATLAHLLGSAAGISTGTTPVPGPGGQIEVGGPTQAAATADVAERGPAAIAAATTLSALPIVLGTAGKAAGTSRLATASGESLRAGIKAVPRAAETSFLRFTGLPQLAGPMIKAFKKSMAETAPEAAPKSAAAAPVAPPPPDPIALAAASRAAELEDFAPGFSKLSPREQAITEMAYNRIKRGPPPSNPPPPGRIAPLYNPPPEPAPVAPTVPQAAPPAPPATVPAETPPQATGGPPTAQERAIAGNRAIRSASADSLSQAFNDAGVTSESLRKLRVWDWPKAAQQVGVDFPVTHSARLKLIRDTLARLAQREAN